MKSVSLIMFWLSGRSHEIFTNSFLCWFLRFLIGSRELSVFSGDLPEWQMGKRPAVEAPVFVFLQEKYVEGVRAAPGARSAFCKIQKQAENYDGDHCQA